MSTIQVERKVKEDLFTIAAGLQQKLGRKVSLNEAIDELIKSYRAEKRDKRLLLSLFGSVKDKKKARQTLHELRRSESTRLKAITRKYGA